MKTCSRCKIEKAPAEFQQDRSRRDGLTHRCKTCRAEGYANYYSRNKQKKCESWVDWSKRNKEERRKYAKEYREKNPEVYAVHAATRRAAKLARTPQWLTTSDYESVNGFYSLCTRVSKCTGIPHHVDHIVPLLGGVVSGLHVPWNLQVIPAKVNRQKSNKIVPLSL